MNPLSTYSELGTLSPAFIIGSAAIIVWSLFWKGLGLWHSAKHNQPWWFVLLMVVNTVGILEIIYLFVVLKLKRSELLK